jgi:hypothetical protein
MIVAALVSPATRSPPICARFDARRSPQRGRAARRAGKCHLRVWFDAALGVVLADRIVEWAAAGEASGPDQRDRRRRRSRARRCSRQASTMSCGPLGVRELSARCARCIAHALERRATVAAIRIVHARSARHALGPTARDLADLDRNRGDAQR